MHASEQNFANRDPAECITTWLTCPRRRLENLTTSVNNSEEVWEHAAERLLSSLLYQTTDPRGPAQRQSVLRRRWVAVWEGAQLDL